MLRWVAVLAAIVLAISAAYGQSSAPSQQQPTLPLGPGHMMDGPGMSGGMMGMDPAMMPMMQHMMQHMTESGMMRPGMMGSGMMGSGMMAGQMAGPMMCRGQMGMMGMAGSAQSHLEARLAFVRSELAIGQSQEPAWEKYAAALRAETVTTSPRMTGMQHANQAALDFPATIAARVTMLEGQLASLKAVRDPALALYGALSPEQQKRADTLLAMPLCM